MANYTRNGLKISVNQSYQVTNPNLTCLVQIIVSKVQPFYLIVVEWKYKAEKYLSSALLLIYLLSNSELKAVLQIKVIKITLTFQIVMVPQSSWLLLQVLSFICFPLVFSISPLCAHLFVSVCGRDFAVHVSDWTLCSNHSPAPDNGGPYLKAEAQPLLDHWTKQLVVTLAPVFALLLPLCILILMCK